MALPFHVTPDSLRALGREVAYAFPSWDDGARSEAVAVALGFGTRDAMLAEAGDGTSTTRRAFSGPGFVGRLGADPSLAREADVAAARSCVDMVLPALPPDWRPGLGEGRGEALLAVLPFLSRLVPNAEARAMDHNGVGRVRLCCGMSSGRAVNGEAVVAGALHLRVPVRVQDGEAYLDVDQVALLRVEADVSAAASTEDVTRFLGLLDRWDDCIAAALLFGGVDRREVAADLSATPEAVDAWLSGRDGGDRSPTPARLSALRTCVASRRKGRLSTPVPTLGEPVPGLVEAPAFADRGTTRPEDVAFRVAQAHAWAVGRGSMPTFVVCDRPSDAPDWWVVRMAVDGRPTTFHFLASERDFARRPLEALGLARIPRLPGDDPVVSEVWL